MLTLRTSNRPSRSQRVDDQLDQILIVVDDQDLALAAVEGVGRDAVVPHERVELVARNAAEAAARHAEALELAGVEAANDRLLADLADLGGFAGRENSLHGRTTSLLSRWSRRGAAGRVQSEAWTAASHWRDHSPAASFLASLEHTFPGTLGCVIS